MDAFENILDNIPVQDSQEFDYKKHIVSNNEINKELDDFITGKVQQGYKIGIRELDDYFVCKKNEFYALTGKKGQGKTSISQALQVMHSVVNGLIWVVAFQENSDWSMKLNYINYLTGFFAKDLYKNDIELYNKALEWIDKHFIFIDVEDIKTATEVCKGIIKSGIDVHALLLDPINSFRNGWQDTGNGYADGVIAGVELLNFSKKHCSVHISQHPTMSAQRQEGPITSYQAEGGWYLNKASFTYVIHRENGSNQNEIIVENVRNKHTGGDRSELENPPILEWFPTSINIGMKRNMDNKKVDVIGYLRQKYNPLNQNSKQFENESKKFQVPTGNITDAFGEDDNIPF